MPTITLESHTGFYMTFRKHGYLLVSNKKNISEKVAMDFLNGILENEDFKFEITDDVIKNSISKIKTEICKNVTVELKENQHGKYWSVSGPNFGGAYDVNEIIILNKENN